MRGARPLIGAAVVALGAGLMTPLVRSEEGSGTIEVMERWSLDWRFKGRGARAPHPQLALVVFDDQTAERAGPLFERRAGWARVIDAVSAAKPAVIGVDALFDAPERLLGEDLQQRVARWKEAHPEAEADPLLSDIAAELEGDVTLAESIRRAGNVVLILFTGDGEKRELDPAALGRARYAQSTPGAVPPREVDSLMASQAVISAAAKGMGFATVTEDETRTVRRLPFARAATGGLYLPFTVPLIAVAQGVNRGQLAYLGPQEEVRIGETKVKLDGDSLWLDFLGPAGSVPTYSALDVVQGRVPAGALTGKVVIIGITRLGYDAARTPFGTIPGAEVQATAADNVLRGSSLTRTRPVAELLITCGLGLLVALLFASRRLSVQVQVSGGLLVLAAWLVGSFLAFSRASLWLPWVMPGLSVVGSLMVGLVLSYASEAVQRRQLKKAFGHYVGADVLDELVAHPEKLSLGGERRTLTVFFSDIRDFTTLSEKLSPVELVAFLNTYLSPMTRAVLRQGGLLDKYIGDAVMAVFGAPVPKVDHAEQALTCLLVMHRELDALNEGPLRRFDIHVAIGVGINTGDMVVGNMGSEERFDYTVAGDSVNLASRLEGLSKVYGVYCLVGDGTRQAAGAAFSFRELDLVQVKGKHQAVAVHELLSGPGRVVSKWDRLAEWELGLAAFRAGKLPQARAHFGAFAAANPTDLAVKRYLERLDELPELAPEGFDAVTAFKSK
ncbi:MAG: adenylate/guanylate cyclase domain-containing protein [Archangium sp.]|nr:adenylate/guanylate cyclase domain-containing protein [Archangium sp.]